MYPPIQNLNAFLISLMRAKYPALRIVIDFIALIFGGVV
jgi:hypothetical protein